MVVAVPTVRPVLVVDDHADSRGVVRTTLETDGFVVVEAENGREALDLLVGERQLNPCLIVLDLAMSVMSGWELLAIIRSYHRFADVPVIVTSAIAEATEALKHRAVIACFVKPVDLARLGEAVRAVTAERAPSSEEGAA